MPCPTRKPPASSCSGAARPTPAPTANWRKMARWMFEGNDHELVDLAFTGVTWPRLETVAAPGQLGMTQICMSRFISVHRRADRTHPEQIARLKQQYPQVAFALGTHFGFDPGISRCSTPRQRRQTAEGAHARMRRLQIPRRPKPNICTTTASHGDRRLRRARTMRMAIIRTAATPRPDSRDPCPLTPPTNTVTEQLTAAGPAHRARFVRHHRRRGRPAHATPPSNGRWFAG